MILFFLRNRCAELLEFRSDRLREPDWLTAAVLFGAREGWIQVLSRFRHDTGNRRPTHGR